MNFTSKTTTVTSYTLGSNRIVVADATVFAAPPTPSYPVTVAFYRQNFLLTPHVATGLLGSTLVTSGPAPGFADVALLSSDTIVPFSDLNQLGRLVGPAIPGGLPFASSLASPSQYGYLEWNMPPHALSTLAGTTATNGTLYVAKWIPQVATLVTNIIVNLGTATITPTASDNWIGIFGPTGSQLGVSAAQDTAFATAGLITAAMTTPVPVAPGTVYYIGFVNTGGTAGKLGCATAPVTQFNIGLTAGGLWFATNGTSVTSFPSSITLASSVVTNALAYWFAVS